MVKGVKPLDVMDVMEVAYRWSREAASRERPVVRPVRLTILLGERSSKGQTLLWVYVN